MLKKQMLPLFSLLVVFFFSGCAHKITLEERIDKRELSLKENKKDIVVGYYISNENLNKLVRSPAGGGDMVSYYPYLDMKSMIDSVLKSVFTNVRYVNDMNNASSDIKYIFTPTIQTQSSSSSYVYWPPEMFSVVLECTAVDSSKSVVFNTKVVGNGSSSVDEFKSDFSIAAKKASKEAVYALYNEIIKHELFATDISSGKSSNTNSITQKNWR